MVEPYLIIVPAREVRTMPEMDNKKSGYRLTENQERYIENQRKVHRKSSENDKGTSEIKERYTKNQEKMIKVHRKSRKIYAGFINATHLIRIIAPHFPAPALLLQTIHQA